MIKPTIVVVCLCCLLGAVAVAETMMDKKPTKEIALPPVHDGLEWDSGVPVGPVYWD